MEEALDEVRLLSGQQQQQAGLREEKTELFDRVSKLLDQIWKEPVFLLELGRFPRLARVLSRIWHARRAGVV
jgi:hypothetical protein